MTIVLPYVSVGQIAFGADKDTVLAKAGVPIATRTTRLGELELRYDEQVVRVSAAGGVVEVSLLPTSEPTVCDVNVFEQPDALDHLLRLDGDPREHVGFLVLLKLGVAITGLQGGDRSQRAVSAFARGRWDPLIGKFKHYRE